MDKCHAIPRLSSPRCETEARPSDSSGPVLEKLRAGLGREHFLVIDQLWQTFRIPASAIGLVALAHEIARDLSLLPKILPQFALPEWSSRIGSVIPPVSCLLSTDATRDLSALLNLPRHPLRYFLEPIDKHVPVPQARLMRALRVMLSLGMLAGKEELATKFSQEFARWLAGNYPSDLRPDALNPPALALIAANQNLRPDAIKILNHIASTLVSELLNPFDEPTLPKDFYAASQPKEQNGAPDGDEEECSEISGPRDILGAAIAEQATATRRLFSGVPTFECMHPFELELLWPKVIGQFRNPLSDEAFAAESALLLGVTPQHFPLLKLYGNESGDISICANGRSFRYDLSKVTEHKKICEPANSTPTLRTVEIPFPEEFALRIRERQSKHPDAVTFDQLFTTPMATLQQSTRSWLRSTSVSSHRLTLSRLIRTWSRYVLTVSRDEAYASLIAMDFTIGTTANFNYLSIRSDRLKAILRECYRRLGYSGVLATEEIEDVLSPRLPDSNQVAALISQLSFETADLISSLPRHCSIDQLTATHNKVAINIYTLVKFLGGSRPLAAETITRSQLDLTHALVAVIDKRVSPYHQERLACLPEFSTTWLNTLLAWLELIAYRLGGIDPELAALIHSATLTGATTDWHPLFFIFVDGRHTAPIGSKELADTLARFGIANNGGRHWFDALLRDANIDSAVSMGHAGRGNPGQELFARWSAAIPSIALKPVAEAIDHWLTQLTLPPIPAVHPRHFQSVAISQTIDPYTPILLQTETAWMALPGLSGFAAPEPCPFSRSTIASASSFPDLFRQWRSNAPPPGWLGVALSLIFEDGVIHSVDLFGTLAELKAGIVFTSEQQVFVDCRTRPLGIRRINLSQATRRLACRIVDDDPPPATFDALEKLMASENSPRAQHPTIRWIIDCAEAYFTLHAPAAVSAWARGLIFARTSRPETIARFQYGCIEPIKFDLRRRSHSTANSGSPAQALAQAKTELENGRSHEHALGILLEALAKLREEAEYSTRVWIEIGYLSNLAQNLDNLRTLLRYENGARTFVRLAADAIDHSGLDEVDWRQTVKLALESRQEGSAPDITGINAVLQWLGIDLHVYKRSTAPPSARIYAETVSAREVAVAANLLLAQQERPGDDYHLANIALRLKAAHALRWDSVAHIRLCDLALACRSPHLVICKEAGADLKTDNAPRVILLTDPELVRDLATITELRKARFPRDPLVPVFGGLHDSRSIETAARVHTLITDALWRATGSPVVSVHDLRHHAITGRIQALLRPGSHREFDTLKLRQGLIECAIDAGQSWPQVAVENYGHDFDVLRSQHFARLIGQLTPPSDQFSSAVAGVPCATLRKRRSRDPQYKPDLLEGFNWSDFRAGATITPLASLVNRDQTHLPVTKEERREQAITPQAIYVGLRLLGEPSDAARMVSGLAEVQARPFEHALASAPRRHGAPLKARGDINRQTFLDAALNSGLAVAMFVVRPHRQGIARIEQSLRCIGDEWTFQSPQDALDLAPWVRVCAANDIGIEFLLRPGKRSLVDGEILDHARRSDFAIARTLPARHFPRRSDVILRFFSTANATTKPRRIRASPQITFLVSTCALSIHIYLKGNPDENEISTS